MVAPYNYSLGVPSPTESFLGGVQAAQQFRQNRLQAEAQQAKLDEIARAKQFTIDVAEAKKDPSGEALNALYDKYPEYGSELKTASDRMDAADKKTYSLFLNRAISAKQRGASSDEIAAIYTEGAATAKNSGRNDIAEKFEAAAIMAKSPAADDDFAARSLLNQFDPDGYKVLYENNKEPFIISNGVAFLRAPLERLGADTEKLMNGTMTAEQYDSVWGEGKASKYMKTGSIDVAPAYHAPTQSDIDNAKAGKISADIFNRVFGPNAFNQYVGGQTGAPAPSGNFPGK